MENKIQLLKPRDFSGVISDTLQFTKINAKPVLQVILFLVLPLLIFGAYFYTRYFSSAMGAIGQADIYARQNAIASNAVNILLGVTGLILASTILYLTIVEAFLKYEASETGIITTSDIMEGIKKDFLSFIGFIFVFGIVVTLGFLLLIGAVVVVALAGKALGVIAGFAAFFGIFYFAIVISLVPFVYMRERNGILDALTRAFYLIKGHWWQTFGVFFITYMIVNIASLIFIIPFYAVFFINVFHGIKSGGQPSFEMSGLSSIAMVFMFCGITIMSSLINVAIAIQYYSLAERKDGVSVMEQIENLNAETPQV